MYWCTPAYPPKDRIIVSPDGVCEAPSTSSFFRTQFSMSEWVRGAGVGKKDNQFHEPLHAIISFHFPLPLKTKLTEAQSFDRTLTHLLF